MKNTIIFSLAFLGFLFIVLSFNSCDKPSVDEFIPTASLSDAEKTDLLFMREEEKLARDVYLHLYDIHGLNIFKNIASSEQNHMDAVLGLMEKYGIDDPVSNEMGVFSNDVLQQLYNDLIDNGEISLIDALLVGARIEDIDIRDLDNAVAKTAKDDLIDLYEKLACGSRNHMRAFTGQLEDRGATYTSQFITQERYEEIINGAHENCGKQ